jgi:Putative beta-barrel porin 2
VHTSRKEAGPQGLINSAVTGSRRNISVVQATMNRCLFMVGLALLPVLTATPSHAETSVRIGLSGDQILRPFIAFDFADSGAIEGWNLSTDVQSHIEGHDGIGDSSLNANWHADTLMAPNTSFSVDAAYGFDHDFGDAIKQYHIIGGDVGVTHKFESFTLKADAGFEARLHEDTIEDGFAPLDRKFEDFAASEFSLRGIWETAGYIRPFVEIAHVGRDYLFHSNRDFAGAEIVAGISIAGPSLSGDAGVIYATRGRADTGAVYVIGPYLDLKWLSRDDIAFSLSASAGIDQDTAGPPDLFPYYSLRVEVVHDIADALTMSLALDAILEDRSSGHEIEISPEIKLIWNHGSGFGTFASASLTHEKTEGQPPTTVPGFEFGISWTWD